MFNIELLNLKSHFLLGSVMPMTKPKQSRRVRTQPMGGEQYPRRSKRHFTKLIFEEAKKYLASWVVKGILVVVVVVLVVASRIPGAYVDPDGVNWTFSVSDDPPVVLAKAQKVEWFGLHYRDIPTLEPLARNAVNAYLIKHKPNCKIFSMNIPTDSPPSQGTTAFKMPNGEQIKMSAMWGVALDCK